MLRSRSKRRSQRRLGATLPSAGTLYYDTAATRVYRVSTFDRGRLSKLLAGILLLALVGSFYGVFSSPMFYVSQIEVYSNTLTSAGEVHQAAGLEGMSIFWVDPEIVRARIEALPYVRRAEVQVRLPAQVSITIEERIPNLVWQSVRDDKVWWIDTEGIALEPRGILEGAIVVRDESVQPLVQEAGQRLAPSILASIRALQALLPELREMTYQTNWGIGFRTGEGWPVYLGDEHQMEFKLAILKELRRRIIAQGATPRYIDVRFPPEARFQIER
jgi:cell division septal protein FtsQ